MSESWEAWEEHLAEKHRIYPDMTLGELAEDSPYALFLEGWNRGVIWCTEKPQGIALRGPDASMIETEELSA